MCASRISWVFYLVGSLLVFGSWMNLVPTALGWVGWLMALGGWAIGTITPRPSVSSTTVPTFSAAEEIAKLDLLRKEEIITEEEFQEQKQRLLERV